MIKARATIGGHDTMIIGLTRDNIDRLLDNQPILFDGAELRWPGLRVVILGGETLDDLREDLRALGVAADDGTPTNPGGPGR